VIAIFKTMYDMLERKERRRAMFVFLLTLIMALVETMGVASIMPFIAVLSNPGSWKATNTCLLFTHI